MVRIYWPKGGHIKPLTGQNVERKVSVSIFRRAAKTIPFRVGLFALAIQLISGADDAHAAACPSGAKARLEISVSNVRAAKGDITITVYPDDKERFLARGGKLSRLRIKAEMPVTVACLSVPGPGTYAIAIYHDENGDGKFDRSMLGLPEEGYGFSNNAAVVLAPPSFDAVKFKAADGVTHVDITMRY